MGGSSIIYWGGSDQSSVPSSSTKYRTSLYLKVLRATKPWPWTVLVSFEFNLWYWALQFRVFNMHLKWATNFNNLVLFPLSQHCRKDSTGWWGRWLPSAWCRGRSLPDFYLSASTDRCVICPLFLPLWKRWQITIWGPSSERQVNG